MNHELKRQLKQMIKKELSKRCPRCRRPLSPTTTPVDQLSYSIDKWGVTLRGNYREKDKPLCSICLVELVSIGKESELDENSKC